MKHHQIYEEEVWKDVPGFEDNYQISSWGNCRSKNRYVTNICGVVMLKAQPIKPHPMTNKYLNFILSKNDSVKHLSAHRLVAKLFIPNPSNLPEVNHLDGVKTNNHVNNLEWTDRKGNIQHSLRTGLTPTGERHPSVKLNSLQVRIIRRLRCDMFQKDIAKIFKVHTVHISAIQLGKRWSHLK